MAHNETRLIRSATLGGYADAAKAAGLDPHAMLARVGLHPSLLNESETLISLDAFFELLALSAAQSGYADFGIRAAIARGIPDLGAVSLLMRDAENIEEAIQLYSSHLTLHADGTFIQLDKRFDSPVIVIEIVGQTREQSVQATQFGVTGVVCQIRWLIGGDFRPELVSFSHCRPADSRIARRFFNCGIRYGQILSGIVIDRQILSRPVVTSPPFLRRLARQHLDPILRRSPNSFSARVQQLMKQMLANGECTSEAVASRFGIDRRTLNRRLQREKETFSSLLQHVRVEISQRAIESSAYSLTELADMTGFQSLSSFSRWFQSQFGCTASEWRKQSGQTRAIRIGPSGSRPIS